MFKYFTVYLIISYHIILYYSLSYMSRATRLGVFAAGAARWLAVGLERSLSIACISIITIYQKYYYISSIIILVVL